MKIIVQSSYSEPEGFSDLLDEALVIHRKESEAGTKRDLAIFVHGLGGTRYGNKSTWGKFPRFIYEDHPRFDVGMYSYRTLFRRFKIWRSVLLEDEAQVLGDLLEILRNEYRSFVLFGHSMGGMLCQSTIAYLLNNENSETLKKIKAIFLLATPQLGSRVSLPWPLYYLNSDSCVLKSHNRHIARTMTRFQNDVNAGMFANPGKKAHIPCWAVIASSDFWVDQLSASIGIEAAQKFHARGTHTEIVKPKTVDNAVYVFIKRSIKASMSADASFSYHECRRAERRDLETIHAQAKQHFGDDVSPLNIMYEWYERNRELFWVVWHVLGSASGSRADIAEGYFCVLPLRENIVEEVARGNIPGSSFETSHIANEEEVCSAIYIGAILGNTLPARATALAYLDLYVALISNGHRLRVLTRPITDDGLRVAQGLSMSPVPLGDGTVSPVYQKYIAENEMLRSCRHKKRKSNASHIPLGG